MLSRFVHRNVMFLAVAILFGVCPLAQAQRGVNRFFVPYSTAGFGIGTSSYYGDMARLRHPINSTFLLMRYSVTGNYTRHFTPRIAGRASLTWARIVGDDYYMNNDRKQHFQPYLNRNLHFRNDLFEFTATGIYKLTADDRTSDRRSKLGAYLMAGVGAVAHNPKARTPAAAGETRGGDWISLRKLQTEGKSYSAVALVLPVGFGLRYKLNKRMDLTGELTYRFTSSDYLDDVSGAHADPNTLTPEAQIMANRSLEPIAARKGGDRTAIIQKIVEPTPRGDNPARKDSYMTGTISFVYYISNPVKCPPIR